MENEELSCDNYIEEKLFDISIEEWEYRIGNNFTKFSDGFLDIQEIISSEEANPCQYCDRGTHQYFIFKQSNNTYGYVNYWLGCETFDERGTVIIKDNLEDLEEIMENDVNEEPYNI